MGLGQNALIVSLIISIFLYLGGARVVGNEDTLGGIFSVSDTPQLSSNATNLLPQTSGNSQLSASNGVGTGVFTFVDGLSLVFNFITFLFNFLASELVLFKLAGAPIAFIYLIAVPLVFLKVLAVVTFIRGIIW